MVILVSRTEPPNTHKLNSYKYPAACEFGAKSYTIFTVAPRFSSLLSHVRISHPDRSRLLWHDHHLRCHVPVRERKRVAYVQSLRKARRG